MGIVFDAAAQSTGWRGTFDLGLTVGAAGQDRIVVACVCWWYEAGKDVGAPTFAGQPMVPYGYVVYDDGGGSVSILNAYYQVAPPVGANNLNVPVLGPNTDVYAAVASYTGVAQVFPFPVAAAVWAGLGACTPSIVVPAQVDALVIDFLGLGSAGSGAVADVGPGQTDRVKTSAAAPGGSRGGGISDEPGAASVTMSWIGYTAGGLYSLIAGYMVSSSVPRGRIVAYTDDLASDDRRLLDANGNRLQPWEIRADAWIRYAGWAPITSVVPDNLVDDPTCGYIEEVSWDSDSDVATTTTSRMDLGEIVIARASAQSAG